MDDRVLPGALRFGHRPWKVADPKARDHMVRVHSNMVRRSVYEAVGSYRALRMEVLDDMKLGKVIQGTRACPAQCLWEDLISLHWAKVLRHRQQSHQEFSLPCFPSSGREPWPAFVGLGLLNLGPFLVSGWHTDGRAFLMPFALGSLFSHLLRNVGQVAVPAYYFFCIPSAPVCSCTHCCSPWSTPSRTTAS